MLMEVGIMYAFALSNSPYGKQDFQVPYLEVQKQLGEVYVNVHNQSRTNLKRLDMFNPKTVVWRVKAGHEFESGIAIEIGHESGHEVGQKDSLTESYNFITVKYREDTDDY